MHVPWYLGYICDNVFQFSCDQCSYKCQAKSALKRHITIKHKQISNLPSEPCPPTTSSSQIISSPAKLPTPPSVTCKPHCFNFVPNPGQTFKCNICDDTFPSTWHHSRHIIYHHPEQVNNIVDYCPNNTCTYFEMEDLYISEGCDCPCDVCGKEYR